MRKGQITLDRATVVSSRSTSDGCGVESPSGFSPAARPPVGIGAYPCVAVGECTVLVAGAHAADSSAFGGWKLSEERSQSLSREHGCHGQL